MVFTFNYSDTGAFASGIGPKEHLENTGIEVVRDTRGVGANLVSSELLDAAHANSRCFRISQQDHIFVRTVYNCPLPDSLWYMIIRPWVLFRELYNYLRHGTGWLLCTSVETEIFGMASLIDVDGRPTSVAAQDKDPFNPNNRPDFAVMTVGSI